RTPRPPGKEPAVSSLTTDRPPAPTTSARPTAPVLWADRRRGWAVLVGLTTVAALASAWVTPRGPLTTTEALVSMALAVGVGAVAGLVVGSRWSMLATPLVYAAVFEVARLGTAGPTVDGVSLTMLGAF